MAGPTVKSVDEELGELAREVRELGRGMADLRNDSTGFRSAVEKELKLIRWIGVFFAGVLVAVVFGSGRVIWDAATIAAEVKQQREEMKELKSDFKQMSRQLDTIIRQTAPASKAGG
jgi:cytoskeletal protein RodZ